jgi:hypothetical protein
LNKLDVLERQDTEQHFFPDENRHRHQSSAGTFNFNPEATLEEGTGLINLTRIINEQVMSNDMENGGLRVGGLKLNTNSQSSLN